MDVCHSQLVPGDKMADNDIPLYSQSQQYVSDPPISKFGRHIVTNMSLTEDRDIILTVHPWNSEESRTVLLTGFWLVRGLALVRVSKNITIEWKAMVIIAIECHVVCECCRSQTQVEVGDVVNVIGEFDSSGSCQINDGENFLVVNPDHLVSGTAVVSGAQCMRR